VKAKQIGNALMYKVKSTKIDMPENVGRFENLMQQRTFFESKMKARNKRYLN